MNDFRQLLSASADAAVHYIKQGDGRENLKNLFFAYFEAVGSVQGRTPDYIKGHMKICAQKVAIETIHALNRQQLEALDDVLNVMTDEYVQLHS